LFIDGRIFLVLESHAKDNSLNRRSSVMRNWTLREMLLLVAVLAFLIFHAAEAVRRRVMAFERFEVEPNDLENWAKEIDPNVSVFGGGSDSSASHHGAERIIHYTFEVPADKVSPIVEHWRDRILEKIDAEGWKISGHSRGTEQFGFSFRKHDSHYDTHFYGFAAPIPAEWPRSEKDKDKVRLQVRWIAIGYTRLYDGKRLVEPAPAAP
jgi:hypothetical protein